MFWIGWNVKLDMWKWYHTCSHDMRRKNEKSGCILRTRNWHHLLCVQGDITLPCLPKDFSYVLSLLAFLISEQAQSRARAGWRCVLAFLWKTLKEWETLVWPKTLWRSIQLLLYLSLFIHVFIKWCIGVLVCVCILTVDFKVFVLSVLYGHHV